MLGIPVMTSLSGFENTIPITKALLAIPATGRLCTRKCIPLKQKLSKEKHKLKTGKAGN